MRYTKWVMILLLMIGVGAVHAESNDWEANLIVSISHLDSRLSFGQRADAGDGLDGAYDVPAMPTGSVRAYFLSDAGFLWSDIRGQGEKSWHLRVASSLKGETVTIKWNPSALPKDRKVILIDTGTGVYTDMKTGNRYSYQNEVLRDLRIEVTP